MITRDDVMEITVLDASTFKLYSDNMRPLLAEQVHRAELVIFYKADDISVKKNLNKLCSYSIRFPLSSVIISISNVN